MATKKARLMKHTFEMSRLEELIEEATVDCNDEYDQAMGFAAIIEDNLDLPFQTKILGATVTVTRIEQRGDFDIAAICERDGERQAISLVDLPLPSPSPPGADAVAAYQLWRSRF
jgi:hypothetical protein